jgi:hypothetical protein
MMTPAGAGRIAELIERYSDLGLGIRGRER